MPLDNALEIIKNVPEIVDCIDLLLYHRPVPHREYDQIYMKARYMLQQVGDIWPSLSNKNVVFLGDGDGMSLLFALLSSKYPMDIKSMSIMDFDERILYSLKEIEESQNLNCSLSYYLYNIINPIDSNLRQKFDYFYINPPYGSKNNGLSCIMWLHRCMDLCSVNAEGCIIVAVCDRLIGDRKYGFEFSKSDSADVQAYAIESEDYIQKRIEEFEKLWAVSTEW